LVKKTAFLYLGVILLAAALVIQMPSVKTVLFQTVTFDNDLPVVSQVQPSGDYYINGQPLAVSARVTDATSGIYHVFWYLVDKGKWGSIFDDSLQSFTVDNTYGYGSGTGGSDGNLYTLTINSGTFLPTRKPVSINTNNYVGVFVRVKGTSNSRWLITVHNEYGHYWLEDGGFTDLRKDLHWITSTSDWTVKYYAFQYAIQSSGTPHALAGTTIDQISLHVYTTNGQAATVYYDWLIYPTSELQKCYATSPSSGSRNDGVWKSTFGFNLLEGFDGWEGYLIAQAADQASPWNVNGQATPLKFVKQATYSIKWIQPADNAIISGTYKFIVEAAGPPSSVKIQFAQGGVVKHEHTLTQESGSNRWSANVDTTKIASGTYTLNAKAYKDGSEVATLSMVLTIENAQIPTFGLADWMSIGLGFTGVASIVYSRKKP